MLNTLFGEIIQTFRVAAIAPVAPLDDIGPENLSVGDFIGGEFEWRLKTLPSGAMQSITFWGNGTTDLHRANTVHSYLFLNADGEVDVEFDLTVFGIGGELRDKCDLVNRQANPPTLLALKSWQYDALAAVLLAGVNRDAACPSVGDKIDIPALVRPYGPSKAESLRPKKFTVVDVRRIEEPEVTKTSV